MEQTSALWHLRCAMPSPQPTAHRLCWRTSVRRQSCAGRAACRRWQTAPRPAARSATRLRRREGRQGQGQRQGRDAWQHELWHVTGWTRLGRHPLSQPELAQARQRTETRLKQGDSMRPKQGRGFSARRLTHAVPLVQQLGSDAALQPAVLLQAQQQRLNHGLGHPGGERGQAGGQG